MRCPDQSCQAEMEAGSALLHATVLGLLYLGFGWQKLFFRRTGGRRRDDVEIMNPDQRKVAHRCPACHGIFVAATPTAPEHA